MTVSFNFLTKLELDYSADERAVRRAYARKLKLIDQEADPTAFQALREAYEAALDWARQPRGQNRVDPTLIPPAGEASTVNPPATPHFTYNHHAEVRMAPLGGESISARRAARKRAAQQAGTPQGKPADNPWTQASEAFSSFLKGCERLVAKGDTHSDIHWEELLRSSLADSRLLSIHASHAFEHKVATLLVEGWKPGHEALLVAATTVFQWHHDPRRLLSLGQAGLHLNRAVEERIAFDQQPAKISKEQRALIARLRDAKSPSTRELIKKMAAVNALEVRFPAWLPMITNIANINLWRDLDRKIPNWRRRIAYQSSPQAPSTEKRSPMFSVWTVVFAIGLISNLFRTLGSEHPSAPSPNASSGGYASQSYPRLPSSPALPGGLLHTSPQTLSERIKSNIYFTVPPDLKINPSVEYEIELAADGTLLNLKKVKPSGLSGFDDAVATAIARTQPYPAEVPRKFVLASHAK